VSILLNKEPILHQFSLGGAIIFDIKLKSKLLLAIKLLFKVNWNINMNLKKKELIFL
jgi:hypothetical protein